MNIKHSKYKNTGLLFELLVRQITADTLSGNDSKATGILKKYFVKTELGREYKLYEALSKYKHITEGKAETVINTLIESSKDLNRGALKRQKYNLIKEIQKYYNLEEFFKTKLPNYKAYASLYTLIEVYNSENLSNPDQIISNKMTLLEHLSSKLIEKQKVEDNLIEEFKSYDKDLRILTYKVMLEKFNGKYADLSERQKLVLKEFINNISNPEHLKAYINENLNKVKTELSDLVKQVDDKTTEIKLNEVITLIKPISAKSSVKDEHLVALLQYQQLAEEIKRVNG